MGEEKNTLDPEKWLERSANALFSFTMARISRSEIAEDLVQDTFLSAYKHAKVFYAMPRKKRGSFPL